MPDVDTNGPKRRRNKRWPAALKREIVAATYLPGSSVSIVARQYDVNANQVFRWRRLAEKSGSPTPGSSSCGLVPVTIISEPEREGATRPTPARFGHHRDRGRRRLPYPRRIELRRPCFEARSRRAEEAMIPVPSGVRVWLSVGRTDMRRGMNGLALQVQETLGRDPFLCGGCRYVAEATEGRAGTGDARLSPPHNLRCFPGAAGQHPSVGSEHFDHSRHPPLRDRAASSRRPRRHSGGLWRPGHGRARPGSSGDRRPIGGASWRENAGRCAVISACRPSSVLSTSLGPRPAARRASLQSASDARRGHRRRSAAARDSRAHAPSAAPSVIAPDPEEWERHDLAAPCRAAAPADALAASGGRSR